MSLTGASGRSYARRRVVPGAWRLDKVVPSQRALPAPCRETAEGGSKGVVASHQCSCSPALACAEAHGRRGARTLLRTGG